MDVFAKNGGVLVIEFAYKLLHFIFLSWLCVVPFVIMAGYMLVETEILKYSFTKKS